MKAASTNSGLCISQRLQEVEQRVRCPIARDLASWFVKPGERAFLHVQVGFDVMVRRDGALVSEPQCDYADVDASL